MGPTSLCCRRDRASSRAPCPPPRRSEGADELLSAVVQLKTYINPDGRTVKGLGQQRAGSGIVIDDKGLILTIGYLMVEAHSAEVLTNSGRKAAADIVGYDHDTGFGLLRATEPLKVKPIAIGKSSDIKEQDQVLAASFGGRAGIAPAYVMSRREFAAGWEYLIPGAIFTAPAHSDWSGAALVSRDGKLVGVGSLVVGDVTGQGKNLPGNMYVPIDLLPPIMADLLSGGRVSGPGRPWLGLNVEEVRGRIFVSRVTGDGPAERAGIKHRRHRHRGQRRTAALARRLLSQGVVARQRRRVGTARSPADRRREARRRQVDEPPRLPAAEIHILISGKLL